MRRFLSGAVVLGLALAATAIASTQFASTFQMAYSAQKPNSSSGLDTLMTWSDPGEPAGKPKGLKRIKFKFHPGTKFDTKALRACKTSDAAVLRLGIAACPASTRVGRGSTHAIAGTVPFQTVVHFFNAKKQIIVLVTVEKRSLIVFRDDVRGGTIVVNLKIPSGVSLTSLHVQFFRHSRKVGRKRHTYMRTPPTCPASGQWVTSTTFTYTDGSSQQLTGGTPCTGA
jgi:hypothetical protein